MHYKKEKENFWNGKGVEKERDRSRRKKSEQRCKPATFRNWIAVNASSARVLSINIVHAAHATSASGGKRANRPLFEKAENELGIAENHACRRMRRELGRRMRFSSRGSGIKASAGLREIEGGGALY